MALLRLINAGTLAAAGVNITATNRANTNLTNDEIWRMTEVMYGLVDSRRSWGGVVERCGGVFGLVRRFVTRLHALIVSSKI